MGNLKSVYNALEYLGEESFIANNPEQLREADRIILPGVGGFPQCMDALQQKGFVDALHEQVLVMRKPIMGICLGLQVMANAGYEIEYKKSLGWFGAEVKKIESNSHDIKVPNIGWESIQFNNSSALFKRLKQGTDFYLVHSYHMIMNADNEQYIDAYYQLNDLKIVAAIRKENIFACQFHPERSSDVGLTMLENFIDWHP